MRIVRLGFSGMALLLISACDDGRDTLSPKVPSLTAPSLSASSAGSAPVQTSGRFDAIVDFTTVTLTPKGSNCLLEVSGRLVFSGTIVGTANGRTGALEFGPCDQVAVNPPGTFEDVFKSVAVFDGTIDGQPAHANLLYMGRVQVGGTIAGRFVFSNGVSGELDVNSIVAVGGTYTGTLVVH